MQKCSSQQTRCIVIQCKLQRFPKLSRRNFQTCQGHPGSIAKIAEVHLIPSEDHLKASDDFPKTSEDYLKTPEIFGDFPKNSEDQSEIYTE